MPISRPFALRALLLGASVSLLAACEPDGTFDMDLRNFGNGFDTSAAARQATSPRPQPDNRGVISYPTYQVALARRDDTVEAVAARVGIPATELAAYNAIAPGTMLRQDEVLALPRRVAEPTPATGAPISGPLQPGAAIDITTLAGGAIDRAGSGGAITPAPAATQSVPSGAEPVRHRVVRGETAYSVARLYGVTAKSLADWNGLGADMGVREGQYLMIPVAALNRTAAAPAAAAPTSAPGTGSPTPVPPSAARPLPAEDTVPAAAVKQPDAPDMGAQKSAASASRLAFPVEGKIIRPYQKRKNDGIDIAAPAGTAVRAAEAGTVAAITQDTEQTPILVIRHQSNLLTVYANIGDISVKKGDTVRRGDPIAKVRASDPAFLHFEVRQGFESVDPMPYLQ